MYIKNKIKFVNEADTIKKDCFYCKVCSYPLVSMLDFKSCDEYHTCNNCYLKFVESRRKEWKEGWRPGTTEIQEYIYLRKQLDKRIIKNK